MYPFFADLKWRSAPFERPPRPKTPPRQLTAEEEEYLEYFTTYCKYSDKAEDYGIDVKKKQGNLGAGEEEAKKEVKTE